MDHVNPFEYGGVVGASAFCNRQQELKDLRRFAVNCNRAFIYSERRMGKTSLVRRMLDDLPKRGYLQAYVDLWPTDSAAAFTTTLAKALSEAGSTRAEKAFETATTWFSYLKPSLSLDQAGNPSLQFGTGSFAIPDPDLAGVIEAGQLMAEKRKRKLVVVFDEFQRIAEYGDDRVERVLRSTIQHHKQVAYLFLGSRKHLIQSMFLDSSRPLYRSATHYPLRPIATAHWIEFIASRFELSGRSIPLHLVESLCGHSEGHPFYTQYLAHTLWEVTPFGAAADDARLEAALAILIQRESFAYAILWDNLTTNQQRLLRGLAAPGTPLSPFSGEFSQRFGLKTPANVQSASRGLIDRDVIDREDGALVIQDRFFRLWIQRTFTF